MTYQFGFNFDHPDDEGSLEEYLLDVPEIGGYWKCNRCGKQVPFRVRMCCNTTDFTWVEVREE